MKQQSVSEQDYLNHEEQQHAPDELEDHAGPETILSTLLGALLGASLWAGILWTVFHFAF